MNKKLNVIDIIKECEFLVYEYNFHLNNELIAKYPEIVIKYNNKCILEFSLETNFINKGDKRYSIMTLEFETKIGNLILNDLAWRKTNFVCDEDKLYKKMAKKKGFQLKNKKFSILFKYLLSIAYTYYKQNNFEYLPEFCATQRFTGSTVERFLKNKDELKTEIYDIEEFIDKYEMKEIENFKIYKTINLYRNENND